MPFPDRESVQGTLRRLEPTIVSIVTGAWDECNALSQQCRFVHTRTERNLMYDRMVARGRDEFSRIPGVALLEEHESLRVIVDDKVVFRLKKADRRGMSRNVRTPTAEAYHNHQLAIPGLEDLSRVEIVYVPNSLGTLLQDIRVVARSGKRFLWWYGVKPQPAVTVEPLPIAPAAAPRSVEQLWLPKDLDPRIRKEAGG